jgi:hypothetical protein
VEEEEGEEEKEEIEGGEVMGGGVGAWENACCEYVNNVLSWNSNKLAFLP